MPLSTRQRAMPCEIHKRYLLILAVVLHGRVDKYLLILPVVLHGRVDKVLAYLARRATWQGGQVPVKRCARDTGSIYLTNDKT